ncbi:MAG: hypothetical protein UX91_C0006G0172 [Candidatus Amesbacteria bacterium GW2011_GWB1_47_19]|nr:MAG: hypothetical protein UW51_C0002G0173 [Candidatus Amesbacteria bacterium GW2011_GWA1_44_24]KKU31236.1 MAG: hypothetical protein UX46_C0006G0028 [Candidatus Amesbacteria bacterium GW2011_GWC1_46_24]KKU67110.1 MAG: hypothetical protein UX91_C0006G0172 [Candidatus Amesbacteria bacterium GW2011_GWB1_47_19]OGD05466.1 MAG: hypothetical protein A2379_00715 [Candidatus Amesbacteria bacterium RIFOXYB1_FULL_47_13]HBC72979.1 hypothetical protein [Candidatus Amesbacteria bacterium]
MNKQTVILLIIAAVAIAGGGGFFAGMKYQTSKRTTGFNRPDGNLQFRGVPSGNGNRMGFRPVAGEIINRDDKSFTVKLNDGGSKIVILSDKTEINKAASGTPEELKVGEKVSVFGTENSDGSVTAQNIQLNPVLRAFPENLTPTL